jgi:uncharacterized HAD superfamily protein
MKIAIDIDEVIVECVKHFLFIHKSKTGVDFNFDEVFTYALWEPLGISREQANEYFNSFSKYNFMLNPDFIEDSKESILFLFDTHKIGFITARPEKMKEETEIFLKNNFSKFNFDLFLSGEHYKNGNKTKSLICKENNFSLLIEDQQPIAEDCARNGTKVLLFDKPWNKNCEENENIIRVKSWKEILERIQELEVELNG